MAKKFMFGDDMMERVPSWFHWSKATPVTHKRHVLAGLHPLGNKLTDNPDARCGNCKHMIRKQFSKVYHKCDLFVDTYGPASDVRMKWHGCVQWEAMDEEQH